MDKLTIESAWIQGRNIEGLDPNMWRLDPEGRLMKHSELGKKSEFGWEIHEVPIVYTGEIGLLGLFPMHWKEN